jgi:gas vesicle protein
LRFVESSLRSSEKRWLLTGPSGGIVSKSYAEGQAYLYNAALGELRTEVQVKARNDGIVLKSASNSVQREIDNLKQKLKEDISALKNELQLEFNHRKEEASDDQKKLELSIQELNSKVN